MHDRARVRGRFAPSPTGPLHLGNARTALLAWLHARSEGGSFILRIEDLDPDRSRPEAARSIVDDLHWLGIDWDEGPGVGGAFGPYTQSERTERYREVLARLARKGRVYPCHCTRAEVRQAASAPHGPQPTVYKYPGTCRPKTPGEWERLAQAGPVFSGEGRQPSYRFAVSAETIAFADGFAGDQRSNLAESIGDFVVWRSDGVAAYHLAVAVDDAAQEITHVVRGDDLLATTPCQIAVLRALELPVPKYLHVPLMMDESGRRLAKRQGDLTLSALRAAGVSPEAVAGFLAWTCGLLPAPVKARPQELVPGFSLDKVERRPAVLTRELVVRLLNDLRP